MNAYILTVLAAALAAAVIELLSPKGEGGRMAGHVRMIAGLFLLAVLLNPLREGLLLLRSAADGDLVDRLEAVVPTPTPSDYEAAFSENLMFIGKTETEAWVISMLESTYGIPPSGCTVEAVCEADISALTLREVRIALHGKYALENPHPIEAYVTERLQCPCFVTVHP